ncbi:MAG: energy transducer TonB [Burkholderiaceae bacterium]|nr:energy transducer TonB [Burkholderiaceae bacterium]
MKPAAIVTTVALHAAAFGAVGMMMPEVSLRTSAQPLEISLLPASTATADAPVRGNSLTPSPARSHAAMPPIVALAANPYPYPTPTIAPANGSTTAGAVGASGTNGAAGSGARTPVSLPADHAASNRKPVYPLLSRRNDEQGTVILRVLVTEDGRAGSVQLAQSSGHPLLDESAQAAVQVWRFRPAMRNNQPIAEWYRLAIPFKLRS